MAKEKESSNCRVCNRQSKEKETIALDAAISKSSTLSWLDSLNVITRLNAAMDDGLPTVICVQCKDDLKSAYKFVEKAKETDIILREKLGLPITGIIKEEESEDLLADAKPDYIDFAKDPLEESEFEDDDNLKSEDEIEMDWVGGNDDDKNFDDSWDDDDDDFDKPLTFFKKGKEGKSKEKKDNLSTTIDSDDDGDIFSKTIEENNDGHNTAEVQIFPIGRYVCRVCKKTYFAEAGLRYHLNVHLPKSRQTNIRSDKGVKRRRKRKNKKKVDDDEDDSNDEKDEEGKDKDSENKEKLENKEKECEGGEGKKGKRPRKTPARKPKKTWPCSVCGRITISASKLRLHMVMHTGEKDFLCTQCPKAYSTISGLKHHMRTHTGERPYVCSVCGDRFIRPTTLKGHMRRHTGERPYGCDICGKRFIQHASMTSHIKLNHMEKNIECPHCDKRYSRQTDLNTHLLSHTGEKPYTCEVCGTGFVTQANVNKHIKLAHTIRSIQCQLCDKKYALQADLTTHMLSHTGDKPYSCQLCSIGFVKQTNLNKHIALYHSGPVKNIPPLPPVAAPAPRLNTVSTTPDHSNQSSNSGIDCTIAPTAMPTHTNFVVPPIQQHMPGVPGSSSGYQQQQTEPNRIDPSESLRDDGHAQSHVDLSSMMQQVEAERVGRSVEDIIRWGWPQNNS